MNFNNPVKKLPKCLTRMVAFCALLSIMLPTFAARNVGTLPHEETFDTNDYVSDLVWITQGATHTWLENGGWRGGAAKFTPPTSYQGYSGVGQFNNLQHPNGDPLTQLNVRFLIYHGSTWEENAENNKVLIVVRSPIDERPMIISRQADVSYGNWVSYGACKGTECTYEAGGYWPDGSDTFRIGNPPFNREAEWISVELESDAANGVLRMYIHTQDGELNGLYVERPITASGEFTFVDILGGYMEFTTRADENTYFLLDEVRIDSSYIGPPEGFLSDPPPKQPTEVSVEISAPTGGSQ
jgi:hypothetical protein